MIREKMKEKDFKGFEDLKVMKDGRLTFWGFKGENAWSRDIIELWKWVELARKIYAKEHAKIKLRFNANDFEDNGKN